MSWDDDFPGARASRPRSQVPNQQLINPFIAVHSCPFVVRRSPSCLSSWPFTDPFRVFSNPLESLGRSSWPFVDKFLPIRPSWITAPPFPTLGGSLSSLLQPLSGPSPFFVALRGYLFAFSRKSFPPFPTLGGSLSSLLQHLSGPSSFFVALRGYLLPFPGNPFPPSRPLAGPSQASSNPLVALRRSSWPFVDIYLPFPGNPFPPSRPLADPS